MKSRKPIREVLLWVFLLGAEALALWQIDVNFGHGRSSKVVGKIKTMPFTVGIRAWNG